MNPIEFKLQPHEIARGFALVAPQSPRTIEWHGRFFDYVMARLDSGRDNNNGIWLRERGQEARGHWIVASSEPPFAPFQMEIRSVKYRPVPEPMVVGAVNKRDGYTLARFVASPLSDSAPYALLIPDGTGCWFSYGRTAAFDFASTSAIEESSATATTWLQGELQLPDSSVKFANNWIALNSAGKISRLYGAEWLAETELVMRHVLRALPGWDEINSWQSWTIHPRTPHSRGWQVRDENSARLLENWSDWLRNRCQSRRLEIWPDHRCINEVEDDGILQASLAGAPSSHQRLESLLWLRDWLRNAATPDECARLLAM